MNFFFQFQKTKSITPLRKMKTVIVNLLVKELCFDGWSKNQTCLVLIISPSMAIDQFFSESHQNFLILNAGTL